MHTLFAGATLAERAGAAGRRRRCSWARSRQGAPSASCRRLACRPSSLPEIVRQTNAATKEAVYAALQADAAKALKAIERGGGEVVEIKGKSHEEDAHDRRAFLAQRYAALSVEERARTVLADPSREGRKELNEQVRAALQAQRRAAGAEARRSTSWCPRA